MPQIKPYKGSGKYVFVSYSHRDMDKVLDIIKHLIVNNYNVWYDEGIDPGTEWDENIASHVTACECMIAFISENYLNSDNCKDELNFARSLSKERLLVYLEDVTLPPGMAMRLNRLQAIFKHKYEDVDDFYAKLMDTPMLKRVKEFVFTDFSSDKVAPLPAGCKLTVGSHHLTIIQSIGEGYVGSVYSAYDEDARRQYALKVYTSFSASQIPFFQKASLGEDLINIEHENVGRIIDIVRQDGNYLLMDLVEGTTLDIYAKQFAPSKKELLELVIQLLHGLNALHAAGIYYGDVTPSNILVDNGHVRLCDFSVSDHNGSPYVDRTELVFKYRSPERIAGHAIDYRSDIYEAGIILNELTLQLWTTGYSAPFSSSLSDDDIDPPGYFIPFIETPKFDSNTDAAEFSHTDYAIFDIIRNATREKPEERYESARA